MTAPERVQSADLPQASLESVTRLANSERLTALFEQHASFVARVLRRLGLRDGDVDDGLQEVFLVAQSKLDVIRATLVGSSVGAETARKRDSVNAGPKRLLCRRCLDFPPPLSPPLSPPLFPARRAARRGEGRSGSPGQMERGSGREPERPRAVLGPPHLRGLRLRGHPDLPLPSPQLARMICRCLRHPEPRGYQARERPGFGICTHQQYVVAARPYCFTIVVIGDARPRRQGSSSRNGLATGKAVGPSQHNAPGCFGQQALRGECIRPGSHPGYGHSPPSSCPSTASILTTIPCSLGITFGRRLLRHPPVPRPAGTLRRCILR